MNWLDKYTKEELMKMVIELREENELLKDEVKPTGKPYYFSLLEENARIKEEIEDLRSFLHCGQLKQRQYKDGKIVK